MEERESLKKQIELLQNLINSHKSIHGNSPETPAHWRQPVTTAGSDHRFEFHHTFPARLHDTHSAGHWRKKYSLRNKKASPLGSISDPTGPSPANSDRIQERPYLSTGRFFSPADCGRSTSGAKQPSSQGASDRSTAFSALFPGTGGHLTTCSKGKVEASRPVTSARGFVPVVGSRQGLKPTGAGLSHSQQQEVSGEAIPTNSLASAAQSTSLPVQASLAPTYNAELLKRVPIVPLHQGNSGSLFKSHGCRANPMQSTPPAFSDASGKVLSIPQSILPAQTGSSPNTKADSGSLHVLSLPKRSQFLWVKGTEGQPSAPSLLDTSKGRSSAGTRKASQKLAFSPHLSKVTSSGKYTWVSAVAGPQAKHLKRLSSPRASDVTLKKNKPGFTQMVKAQRSSCLGQSAGLVNSSSQYRWKASGVPTKSMSPKAVARIGSVYCWTSEKGATTIRQSPFTSGFKMKSRMKLVRGKSFSSLPAIKADGQGSLAPEGTIRSLPGLRRNHLAGRKAQARGLISFGRHKLRRLSLTPLGGNPRAGSSSPSPHSPAAQRVVRTRYKIVTHRGPPCAPSCSSALSWRSRKVHYARTLLQSRLRNSSSMVSERSVSVRPWGGRGMRWIGGALYRVSANKLCRTALPSGTTGVHLRAGKCSPPQDALTHNYPSVLSRASSTRQLASRAVQRSRSIIRNALHRKQQGRQYCMYYNRFGRCNRGHHCPFIHDPDKVAVCTRFLRGTCKQTDGTCPFSHKVSKEKMPVCSYYLRGICNNNSCPYSHVYVSRKAAICQDFVRGYCPQGEKCKKKHTLLCPDYSSTSGCPRGSKCQMQHRTQAKRGGPRQAPGPAKKARKPRSPDRSETAGCSLRDERSPTDPNKLPSFISLSSSPETSEVLDMPPVEGSEVSGDPTVTAIPEKKFQIKPRF